MGIIDLNIEHPAWKRTVEPTEETEPAVPGENPTSEAKSRGRVPRATRIVGMLAVGVVGLVTLRKVRGRRRVKRSADDASDE